MGLASMSTCAYGTAWLSMVQKSTAAGKVHACPECFDALLNLQNAKGS